jgi:YHS domain-containing protein
MITRILSVTIVAAVLSAAPASVADQEKISPDQTACPITGKGINKDIYVDHDGNRIYLCCPGCKERTTADADKIISRLQAQGIKLAKTTAKQTLCPVMGGDINKELYSDHEGNRIYFCCAMCKPIFDKEPVKYIEAMEAKNIELAKAEKKE